MEKNKPSGESFTIELILGIVETENELRKILRKQKKS